MVNENIVSIKYKDKEVYLIGTAHISRQSAELVEETIKDLAPDTVCVELCASRFEAMRNPEAWRNTDILRVLREGKGYVLLTQLVLASFQKRIAKDLQLEPGLEMRLAIEAAESIGAKLELVDRDIKITLKRALGSESLWKLIKLGASILFSVLGAKEKLTEEEIENLKGKDVLGGLLEDIGKELPGLKKALIDERDLYLSNKIFESQGKRIVAVVGAGHLPGIQANVGNTVDILELEKSPKSRKILRSITWSISCFIVCIIVWGFLHFGTEVGNQMIFSWVVATGLCSALGSAMALAHPLTVVVSLLSAPITCLFRAATTGGVAGIMEAMLRKPVVSDFETIAEDLETLKRIYSNRLSRVFLVMMLTNLGAVVGTFVGGYAMLHEALSL